MCAAKQMYWMSIFNSKKQWQTGTLLSDSLGAIFYYLNFRKHK